MRSSWPQLPSSGPSNVNSDSHSTPITRFRRLLKALLSCHSRLVINYIAINRCAHNPKVGGSNPYPSTNQTPSESITYVSGEHLLFAQSVPKIGELYS